MKQHLKTIIFDLDGTLLDTLLSIACAFNRALDQLGYPQHATEAYRHFIGDGVFQCASRCLPASERNEATINQLVQVERVEYANSWHQQVQPYQGIVELLAELSKRGILTSVLTNKDQAAAEQCVHRFFPEHSFLHIIGHDGSRPHKPDPSGGEWILKASGVNYQQAAMVGDTAVDILTGKACKMLTIGVSWGFREPRELNEAGAAFVIEQPHQLLELL